MIALDPKEYDDPQFVELISRTLTALAHCYKPIEIYVIHIDNWFDHKWKGFSGVADLQVGTWLGPTLRVPPFNPNRVVSQTHLHLDDPDKPTYVIEPALPLHIYQPSSSNLRRSLSQITKSGLFAWYSGGTKKNDRASLMVYRIEKENEVSWYGSFLKKEEWRINKVTGISKQEFARLIEMFVPRPGV